MFTGIVAATGAITDLQPLERGIRLTISADGFDMSDVGLGDSIACNGICLTVVARAADRFEVDVSRETLDCTVGLEAGGLVNLEKALRVSDRLGGHLVSGHVDGVGEVVSFERSGESHELVIRAPDALARYLARKGSIAINGVSLTINRVVAAEFSVNIIPHTLAVTSLKQLRVGASVNLEVDMIARYVERMLNPA